MTKLFVRFWLDHSFYHMVTMNIRYIYNKVLIFNLKTIIQRNWWKYSIVHLHHFTPSETQGSYLVPAGHWSWIWWPRGIRWRLHCWPVQRSQICHVAGSPLGGQGMRPIDFWALWNLGKIERFALIYRYVICPHCQCFEQTVIDWNNMFD